MSIFKRKTTKKVLINPAFFIILIWLICATNVYIAISYFFAILIHELGHYYFAKFFGYKLTKFSLSPYGVSLSYYGQTLEQKDEIYIALAGPLANLITAFSTIAVWWIFPTFYFLSSSFVEISVVIALTNLLPAYPLDGGRIFVSCVSNIIERRKALKITIVFNIILSLIFYLLFFVFCFINFNPTYLLFAVFLTMGVLDLNFLSVYEKINIFNKKTKNFSKPKIYVVNEDVKLKDLLKKIQGNRTSIFVLIQKNGKSILLSDEFILKLSLTIDIDKTFEEILKNKT